MPECCESYLKLSRSIVTTLTSVLSIVGLLAPSFEGHSNASILLQQKNCARLKLKQFFSMSVQKIKKLDLGLCVLKKI